MAPPATMILAPSPPALGLAAGTGRGPALAALVLGAVAMGLSPIFVRVANAEVGPFASAFWRVALALPVLYAWMRVEGRTGATPAPALSSPVLLLAGCLFAGDLFFWHLAVLATTVANATLLATMAPVFVVLATWLVLRRRVERATLAGLALCLLGGGALVGQSLVVDPGRIGGDLCGLATALFFGLYFLAVERARAEGHGPARVTFAASCVTAAVLLVVVLALESRPILPSSLGGATALVAMAWVSHAGGQGLLSVALGRLPATYSSLVVFLEALAAAGFAWALLGEALSPIQGLGGAAILAGIGIARPREPGRPREARP